jgi:2,3-bisphosphoglycerate-independent phosphoglycerate mutase
MAMRSNQKVLLVILDGYGLGKKPEVDATYLAKKPYIDSLYQKYSWIPISASGEDVGLPDGQMGNSEVGHMNIGAGRVVYQEITRIDRSIRTGEFFQNKTFIDAIENVKNQKAALHLIGLLSDGGVHSMNTHLYALLELAKREGIHNVFVHALLDGRDTPPESGAGYLGELKEKICDIGVGDIASVMGRFYGMDRDNRWDRVEKAYRAITKGEGVIAQEPVEAVRSSYQQKITDEFVVPVVIQRNSKPVALIKDRDSVIFFNFRSDRARQLTQAFIDDKFDKFEGMNFKGYFGTMTQYNEDFTCPVAFPPQFLTHTLGQVISDLGMKQLRLAETEKYAHVTFFFNGGKEEPFPGETRILVPSPRGVATYDQKPEMSAYDVTARGVEELKSGRYDLVVVNYANCDMVGHSGIMEAAIRAVEVVDDCLYKLIPVAQGEKYFVIITADHGNVDKMVDDDGKPMTAHTTNLVPFIMVKDGFHQSLRKGGKLSDVAPTILKIMDIHQPPEMDGSSFI